MPKPKHEKKTSRVSISFVVLATVFVLVFLAVFYWILEITGLAPVIVLGGNMTLTAGEQVIVFVIWIGVIVFLALLVTFAIARVTVKGMR